MIKVSWITPSPFVDVDLPILVELQKTMNVYWQIIVFGKINDDLKKYIESQLKNKNSFRFEYVEIPYRVFDLRTMGAYRRVLKNAKSFHPDLFYTSDSMAPFGPVLYRLYFPRKLTIAACHNVSTPKGANREFYSRLFTDLHIKTFSYIQVFSESQRDILNQKYANKTVLLAPLAIKDYGEPSIPPKEFDKKKMVFLFFGIISPYKRLDLLIEAAQNLYERGCHNFKVKIAGNCKTWQEYASKIKYPEIFDIRIEHIPNSEVADLFAESDYLVMPYKDIAQSGAITVAYRYTLPIILSDLPQFRPFVEEGRTGFFFEKGNSKALEDVMIKVIEGGESLYKKLQDGLVEFVEERYSTQAITKKYEDFFEKLLKS